MNTPTLYGIRNCDTMKKARTWLDAAGVAYRFHDYRVDGLDPATRKVVPEAERASLDGARARELMLAHPSMVRRPVLDIDGQLLVGFDATAYAQAFPAATRS
jgi:arsenate reductase